MPNLVRQAAVHGFSKEQLCEAEMALQDSSVRRREEASASPAPTDNKVVLVRNIMKAWIDVRRTARTLWSGKLPRPRISPVITLGDCAVTDVHGRRPVARGTLTEVLRETSSATPATTKTTWLDVERRTSTFFQNPPDPKLMPEERPSSRSVTHAGTGGPHDEVQRGPCTLNGQGRCRCRGAKLAVRFLLKKFDLDSINRKTLAATPYSVYPSYIQVLRAGMAAPGVGGVGNGGGGSEGGGAGGRGLSAGCGGGCAGGGCGACGGRQGYGDGYGYNYYDEGAHFNGPPRFNPNLRVHPPNYGPG